MATKCKVGRTDSRLHYGNRRQKAQPVEAGMLCSLGSLNSISAGEVSRGPVGLSQCDSQQEGTGQGLTVLLRF